MISFFGPRVVAAGQDIHFGLEQFLGGFRSKPPAARGVFGIGDDHVNVQLTLQTGHKLPYSSPARLSHNIA